MSQGLIFRGNVRLVTIIGPPGVGKTRFAIELAAAIASEFDDGVVFVDLTPVRDPGLVLDAIAQALGVVYHPDQPALQRLRRHLRDRNLLLLLDNLEHVITAAGDVTDLLAAGPHVKVLATSRQPLHVRLEHRYNLLPLALPDAKARSDQATLARSPATALGPGPGTLSSKLCSLRAGRARLLSVGQTRGGVEEFGLRRRSPAICGVRGSTRC